MDNFLNLKKINQEEAVNLSKFFINSNNNMILFGKRGTGKTQIALQSAKELNLKVNYINLSVIERADICGFPDINSKSDTIKYKSPYYFPELLPGKTPDSILLFDEVDKCSPEITAPLLEVLQFKSINGKPINAKACILTANLLNEGAYSNQISTAILDRCSKYILDFSFDKWVEWCKLNNVNDLILSFLISNQDLAVSKDDDISYASPSPRSWVLASRALDSIFYKNPSIDDIINIISGFVGNLAALKFKSWYEYYRKHEPLIKSIINKGSTANEFNLLFGTEKLVFIISACNFAKQQVLSSKNLKYLENLTNFLISQNIENEIIVLALSNSFNFEIITKNHLYKCVPFFELFKKINDST